MTKKSSRLIQIIVLFLAYAVVYVGEGSIHIGGFGFPYKYLLSICIIGITFLWFMVSPDFEKGKKCFLYALVFSAPLLISILYSMLIWILRFMGLRFMTRGLFYPTYVIIAICTAASLVYVYETRAVWVMTFVLVSMCIYRMVLSMIEAGPAVWFEQWLLLMQTFGIEVGHYMSVYEEYNEILFGVGIFLMYFVIMLIEQKKVRQNIFMWLFFLLGVFAFVTGFKRIALIAIPICLLIYLIALPMNDRIRRRLAIVVSVITILFSLIYLIFVATNLFTEIAVILGIDTKGRDELFDSVKGWYSFSPVFFGQGLGYVSRTLAEQQALLRATMGENAYIAGEIHNDILRNYIELGFYGFPIWLYLMTVLRVRFFEKSGGGKAAIVAVICILYMFITYTTDNTYYYNMPNLAAALTAMTFAYQKETSP